MKKSLLLSLFIIATLFVALSITAPDEGDEEAGDEKKEEEEEEVNPEEKAKSMLDDILSLQKLSTKASLGGDGKPEPTPEWKPVIYPMFAKMSKKKQKRLMGDKADRIVFDETANKKVEGTKLGFDVGFEDETTTTTTAAPLKPIPDHFDSREAFPLCKEIIGNIRTQSGCGSCWAVSTASVFTDRLCIAAAKEYKKINPKLYISEGDTMSCANPGDGCPGGNAYNAFTYFIKVGAVSGGNTTNKYGCIPYPFSPDQQFDDLETPDCKKECENTKHEKEYEEDKYYMADHTRLNGTVPGRIEKMQREIMENGPIHATLMVYEDFMHYGGGIYSFLTGDEQGTHAVRMIGWGEEKDSKGLIVKYWLIANSWGYEWGEKGLFRILRGKDEAGIETNNINYGNVVVPPEPE